MILLRLLGQDVRRSKGTLIVVFVFIFLAALLMAGGVGLVTTLGGALDVLFDAADVPDVVQMHAGTIDQNAIEEWASAHPLVARYQTNEMLTIDGEDLFIGRNGLSERESVMDISFVRPNREFDLLVDTSNEIFAPKPGEIGVPIYYASRDDLTIGDTVSLETGDGTYTFTIASFIRDAQMNPSIIHSKRFVIHRDDYLALTERVAETEYLITFQLTDPSKTDTFIADYQGAGLPQRGPIVDKTIFRTLNALSDGIVAAVTIVLSLILMVIAILCVRLTILASIEEEYRQIGVMKAIGIQNGHIRRLVMVKYAAISLIAGTGGFALSFPLAAVPARKIVAAFGSPQSGPMTYVAPAIAALAVIAVVNVVCILVLRRIGKISPVAALRGDMQQTGRRTRRSVAHVPGNAGVNLLLGLNDLRFRPHLFLLLGFIFIFAAATIIVPVHFLSTINSPSFISYMGIGRSDMRIDLRQTNETADRYVAMVEAIGKDPDVTRFAPLVTSQYTLLHPNGETETIAIENGDLSQFPLDFLSGEAPTTEGDIALSYLLARDLSVDVGETLTILVGGAEESLTISGIYQDVTNGGRTAKGRLPYNPADALWYSVSVDFTDGISIAEKRDEYSRRFAPARVTDIEGYIAQTLGTTIDRVQTVTIVAIGIGLGISALITSLFLQMLIRKDRMRIAVQRSIGFSVTDIRRQYLSIVLTVLLLGIALGTIISNTLGRQVVGFLWSFMGASQITFVVEPLKTYIGLPILFVAVVAGTTAVATSHISQTKGELR